MTACPNCRRGQLHPTATVFTLTEVLHRWERDLRHPLTPELWAEYAALRDDPITLHQCDHCHMHWFLPIVTGTERFYFEVTQDSYYNDTKWEFRRAAGDLKRRGRANVLDVGCGSGAFLHVLRARNGVVGTGFEFNASLLSTIRERGFHALESLDDPAAMGRFDAVTMFQVIEHVADPMAIMDQLDRLLVPGGTYILAMPDMNGPIGNYRDAVTDNPPHHVSRWGRPAMLALGKARGYTLQYVTTEWLPRYLWRMYLPTMLVKAGLPFGLGEKLRRWGLLEAFIRIFELTPLQEMPFVPGHSLYAVFEKR